MQEEKRVNVVATVGLAGALLGAGLTAAALALTNRNNRRKVVHSIRTFKKQAADVLSKAGEELKETRKEVEKQSQQISNDIKEPAVKSDEKILRSL